MENNVIKKYLLIEGETDERFLKSLFRHISNINPQINPGEVSFRVIGGSDLKKLSFELGELRADLRNKPIQKIGIVLDIDTSSKDEKTKLILSVLEKVFGDDLKKKDNGVSIYINEQRSVIVSFHFIEDIAGINNLERLLQSAVNVAPTAADCLKSWYDCTQQKGLKVSNSDYLKRWIDIYIRHDYCSDKELKKHAVDNCTFEKSLDNMFIDGKLKAWNFDAESLKPLNAFLTNFLIDQ